MEQVSVEENLRVIERWVEAYNAHDVDSFAELFSETAFYDSRGPSYPLEGREAIRKHFPKALKIFPDTHLDTVRIFGQGNLVCVELVQIATNEGPVPTRDGGMASPKGKRLELPFVIIFELEEGQIVEATEYYDRLAFNTQLDLAS